ncbi:MAG: PIG-L family deacetylase [Patescibacteria group bacterium]|nr:PIG-L family deacetylase [Patescibacteria group bacterium]
MTKKILAIGPHPDDLEFSIGGILIKEVAAGNSVEMLVMSKGEAASNGSPEVRQQEAALAAKIIGAKLAFTDFGGDGHLIYSTANVIKLAELIRQLRPNIIITNGDEQNQHPDHVQASAIVRAAARLARYGGINELKNIPPHQIDALYFYSATLNTTLPPDLIIDITNEVKTWEKTMTAHASQLKTRKYVDLVMARAKILGLSINTEYAQGLYANDPLVIDLPSTINSSARNF